MKLFHPVLAAFLLVLLTVPVLAQVTQEWAVTSSTTGNHTDKACAIAVDNANNVIVAANLDWISPATNIRVIKYDSTGTELWHADYDSPNHDLDNVNALAVDASNNIYITGCSATSVLNNAVTLKYSPEGQLLWSATRAGSVGYDIGVSDIGEVYVTGKGNLDAIFTTKYNSSGTELWTMVHGNIWSTSDPPQLALDDQANVYVISGVGGYGVGSDWLVVKYTSFGAQQWENVYVDPWNLSMAMPSDVVVDHNGHIYVGGYHTATYPNGTDYSLVKYDAVSGSILWSRLYNGLGNGNDEILRMALDNEGNIYVTGESDGMTGPYDNIDVATVKYNPDGVQLWVNRFNGPGNKDDYVYGLAVDQAHNVYVTGHSSTTSPWGMDCFTLKCTSQGATDWIAMYSADNAIDYAEALAVDSQGHVYIAGATQTASSGYDILTVKYDQSNPAFDLTLVPFESPIVIPAGGGSFDYLAMVNNGSSSPLQMDAWTRLMNPWNIVTDPLAGPASLTIPAGSSARYRRQNVPASWVSGNYSYYVYAGDYPSIIWACDTITFTKSATAGDGPIVEDWRLTDLDSPAVEGQTAPASYLLPEVRPNPFNPSTAISYTLQAASQVRLEVYDTAGRLVSTLVDERQEAGQHSVTFNGSVLTSGIYLYRLQASDQISTGKMILLK